MCQAPWNSGYIIGLCDTTEWNSFTFMCGNAVSSNPGARLLFQGVTKEKLRGGADKIERAAGRGRLTTIHSLIFPRDDQRPHLASKVTSHSWPTWLPPALSLSSSWLLEITKVSLTPGLWSPWGLHENGPSWLTFEYSFPAGGTVWEGQGSVLWPCWGRCATGEGFEISKDWHHSGLV